MNRVCRLAIAMGLSLFLCGCPSGLNSSFTYNVTPAGTNVTLSPGSLPTVKAQAAASFTVAANTGYTLSSIVGGTCPVGSWSGFAYTTGKVTGDCTVTFRADINHYSVTYDGNGNTGGMAPTDPSSPYKYQSTVTVLGNTGGLFKTGYTFSGWNTSADGSGTAYAPSATFILGAGNVVLYAQWTINSYAVTYNGNGNTGGVAPTDTSSPYKYQSTVAVLGNTGSLVRTGYTFSGWNTSADGSGTAYAPSATFTLGAGNVVLYAQWTINTYTVTYYGNGNTGGMAPTDTSSPYKYQSTVAVLGNTGGLLKTGYTFSGWNTSADGSGTAYAPSATFTLGAGNVVLYAQWTINSYTVTYNGNGNTGGVAPTDTSSPYKYQSTVAVLGNTGSLVRTGYTFSGWNTSADGSGTAYAPSATFTLGAGNVVLYAQWTINTYTVTYYGNGNTGGMAPTDPSSPYKYQSTVTVLGNTGGLFKTGYTFSGWNTSADGSGTAYAPSATFILGAGNVVLYAQWTINSYAVTYNGNGNTGGVAPTDTSSPYKYQSTVAVLGNTGSLVRTGYTFSGWNTSADGSGTAYAPSATFTLGAGNVVLYAQWTINTYTVTYYGNGNTGGMAPTDTSSPYKYHSSVTVLGNGSLVKTGYSFNGWNTAADGCGTSYAPSATFTLGAGNVVLYAQWKLNTYTVTPTSTNVTLSPNTPQTVNYNATQAFSVSASVGSLPVVGGTCPAGSWTTPGRVYTTGTITAGCTVTFTGTPVVFTPTSGPIGTLITITGPDFSTAQSVSVGGQPAIAVRYSSSSLLALVVPGTSSGMISVTTSAGSATTSGSFAVTAAKLPSTQQGSKLVGTGAVGHANQGRSIALSADGNTALVGGLFDDSYVGAAWVFTRSNGSWTQQGSKLVGTGADGIAYHGTSVALSADGNTALVGGEDDSSGVGAAWVFTRSDGSWTQQGAKLVGTQATAPSAQGSSVALSADGNTALIGGNQDNSAVGATWVFIRSNGSWSQQGAKLVGTGAIGAAGQGVAVALSAHGNTALIGGDLDDAAIGATWVFTRSNGSWTQQGGKLVGTGALGAAYQGVSVSLSADGNTALAGGENDDSGAGAAWVFTRSDETWTQQGAKLVGTGAVGAAYQGASVSLSADGNTALVGGQDDDSGAGAAWVFTRSHGSWTEQSAKLIGTGAIGTAFQGQSVCLSADASTGLIGGPGDNSALGAVWVFVP